LEPSLRALPTLPNPTHDDCAARRHWSAITIAVAWELARALPKVHPAVLTAARDHAAHRVPVNASLPEAEAVAVAATAEFLGRKRGIYALWHADPDWDILPDPRWRDAVIESVTPLHEAVFRLHYGDGVPLEELAVRLKVDLSWLRPAREAVRELVRTIVAEDGVSTKDWEPARLDRLVLRVALAASDRCPGPGGLGTDAGRAHSDNCPRCSRAFRLFRDGVFAPGHLFAPPNETPVPALGQRLVALQVQGDDKRAIRAIAELFPTAICPSRDFYIFPYFEGFDQPLRELCEAGTPAREHLRLAVIDAVGRVESGVIVGAAYEQCRDVVGAMPWGETRGIEALPAKLPPPPSAARYWAAALLIGSLAAAAAFIAFSPPTPEAIYALTASRVGDEVVFDTDDGAYVDILSVSEASSQLVFHSESTADKAVLSTGDGRFRVVVDHRSVLVVASNEPIAGSRGVVGRANSVGEARDLLRSEYPGAAVVVVR
jgi:hypothetical protein